MTKDNKHISASIMCADMLNLKNEIRLLEEANIDYLHIDIMDGKFVPNYAIGMETISQMRKITNTPFDYHLMVTNPEETIRMLELQNNDMVAIHIESKCDINKIIDLVKSKGAKFGLAINPETKVSTMESYISKVDFVLIMLVKPGFSGQPMIKGTIDKIEEVKKMFKRFNNYSAMISIDGNVGHETIKEGKNRGANIFVAGTTCLFKKSIAYKDIVEKIRGI